MIDTDDLTAKLLDWIEIPSVTGSEGDYGDALARDLERRGFSVEKQLVEPGRFNVLARAGSPEVVFCTHLDTVPPFFGSLVKQGTIFGRGACDAKGQAVAMVQAAEEFLRSGEDRIGLLFTVGEEATSDGARVANSRLSDPWRPRTIVVGEPTGGRFVSAGKGLLHGHICARGITGHSSQPGGPSAIHELVHSLERMLQSTWGEVEGIGRGTINIGQIRGGLAANVYAPEAEAEILVRAVEEPRVVAERIRSLLGPDVTLEASPNAYGPIRFLVPDGEESIVVAFGTDTHHLRAWGTPVLIGPGSISDAHTEHEKIEAAHLALAVARLRDLGSKLLARP